MKSEYILAALAVVIVILLVFTFTTRGNGGNSSCATKLHDLPGKPGLTTAEVCTGMNGTWDATKNTCMPDSYTAMCNNPTGLVRDTCTIAGGTYYPYCNICSGPNMRSEITMDELMPAFTKNCANMMQ